jgi:hypothetical protein
MCTIFTDSAECVDSTAIVYEGYFVFAIMQRLEVKFLGLKTTRLKVVMLSPSLISARFLKFQYFVVILSFQFEIKNKFFYNKVFY